MVAIVPILLLGVYFALKRSHIVVAGYLMCPKRKNMNASPELSLNDTAADVSEVLLSPNTTLSLLASDYTEMSSGSGSGPPAMVQRTISRQITLLGIKGKGR